MCFTRQSINLMAIHLNKSVLNFRFENNKLNKCKIYYYSLFNRSYYVQCAHKCKSPGALMRTRLKNLCASLYKTHTRATFNSSQGSRKNGTKNHHNLSIFGFVTTKCKTHEENKSCDTIYIYIYSVPVWLSGRALR